MKRAAAVVAFGVVAIGSASARAEEASSSTWVGAELSVLPSGTFESNFLNVKLDSDVDTAYGVGFFVIDRITPHLAVGFAPRMLVNVAPSSSDRETGQELDLRARIEGGTTVLPRLRVFGAVDPGYSVGFPPSDSLITSHPHGFIIGVGGGVGLSLGPRSELTFELGYQWGFQGGTQHTDFGDANYTLKDNYLHFAFGIAGTVK